MTKMIYPKMLYLLRGLPGSGKSTLARRLYISAVGDCVHFETDDYWTDAKGDYNFNAALLPTAHKWNQERTEGFMDGRGCDTIIVANTFTQQWEMEPYREMARKYGYQVTVVTVDSGLTDEQLAARNVHGVPVDIITKMRQRWEN